METVLSVKELISLKLSVYRESGVSMSNLNHNERIEKAIEDLNSSDKLNYAAIARKWSIERTTLAKRHKG